MNRLLSKIKRSNRSRNLLLAGTSILAVALLALTLFWPKLSDVLPEAPTRSPSSEALASRTPESTPSPIISPSVSTAPTPSPTAPKSQRRDANHSEQVASGNSASSASSKTAIAAPASIAADCSRDVTQELLAWIASIPNSSTLQLQQGACYRVEGSLRITDRAGLTLLGNGATIKSFSRGPLNDRGFSERRHIWFLNSRDITIRDLKVEGTNTTSDVGPGFGTYNSNYEFEHAFAFDGVQNLILENLSADAIWGDGLYLGSMKPVRHARVSGLSIDRNGRQGVGISYADGVLLENVRILHSRQAAFDMEPLPDSFVRGVEIRNSSSNSRLLAFASKGVRDASNIYIHNNTITGTGVPWVYVNASDGTRRHDWRVHNNTLQRVLGSPLSALYFANIDNVDVQGNISRLDPSRDMKPVKFSNSGGTLRVINNDFTGACEPYSADADTGPVEARDNILSAC